MRENMGLYRGKRKDNGEWIEGYLCRKYFAESPHDRCAIQYETTGNEYKWTPKYMTAEVIPETIGEFTGLYDNTKWEKLTKKEQSDWLKNHTADEWKGRKIFEGDIVDAVYKSGYVGIPDTPFGKGVIVYGDSYYHGASYGIDIIGESGLRVFSASLDGGVEIIGNIHDNPELLEVRENG